MNMMISSFANFMLKMRMFLRVLFRLMGIIFIVHIILFVCTNIWLNPSWDHTKLIMTHHFSGIGKLIDKGYLNEAADIVLDGLYKFWLLQKSIIVKSASVWILLPMILLYIYLCGNPRVNRNEYIRGAKFLYPDELNRELHKSNPVNFWWGLFLKNKIPFGEVYLPIKEENKQTFIVGKPGSGKTNAFNQIIEVIRKRRQKLIIHDYKGDYVCNYLDSDHSVVIYGDQ